MNAAPASVSAMPATHFPVKRPLERLLAETSSIAAGTFRCAADDPRFVDSGPSSTYCFVFPRTEVWIQHAGAASFVTNAAIATLYNEGQSYTRRRLSPEGDRSDWFAIAPDLLEDVIAGCGAPWDRGSRRLFTCSHVRTESTVYLRQRRLVERLLRGSGVTSLEVEETAIGLLVTLLRASDARRSPLPDTATRRQRHLVNDARVLLTLWYRRNVEIADLARQLGCSVFHLSRTFRRVEGTTIHEYQMQLRLRAALEQLASMPDANITDVALDLGFCSHSHFTAAFRRTYGVTPSEFTRSIAHR